MTNQDPKPNHPDNIPVDPENTDPIGVPPQNTKPSIIDPNKLSNDPSTLNQPTSDADKKKQKSPKDPKKTAPYIDKPDIPYIDGPDVPTDGDTIY